MPKWLGEVYSKLWAEFRDNIFYFDDANKILGKITPNYLSELKKNQALFIFERRSKKRVYRLIPPNLFAYAIAKNIDLGWLKQGAYANLILMTFMNLKEKFTQNLLSFGIFGSLARNMAKSDSDIDLLLVFKDLLDSFGERLKLLIEIESIQEIRDELDFLNKDSIYPRFSYQALKKSELEINPFTIDLVFDLRIIYDTNVLEDFAFKINEKIRELNIKRKYLDKTKYYLDLNIAFGKALRF